MIKIEKLQKYYNKGKKNEQHVLKGVSLELGETGLVCLLGESGCGKTTLLNTVGGLDEFSGGSITINDTTVNKYDPKKIEPVRNDHFGYIFQNYYLLMDYTVAYNIKIALNRYDLTDEEKEARVDYVLELMGMSKYKKKPVSKLSGGQQQRVSIARALVKSPDIIFADEPTGNLDEENTLRTMSILKSISKTCLVLLVTHERRIANFFADRIIEIKDGEIFRDEQNRAADAYERMDDANIYLKELECHQIESDYAKFRVYCNKGDTPAPVRLNLAWKDGKLYIQNEMGCDIIMEGAASGVMMLDANRPKFDVEEMDKISYSLERPKPGKNASLSPREIWRMATENIRLMGKKQSFVLVILLATAILLSVTVAEIADSMMVDESSFVTTDDHYTKVVFEKVSSIRDEEQQQQIFDFEWAYLSDGQLGTLMYVPGNNIYLQGQGLAQMREVLQSIKNFSYAEISLISEEDLVYGEMAERRDEVVVDISVARAWLESGGTVSSFYDSVEEFIGTELYSPTSNHYFEIVGICDTDEPDIYVSQNLLLSIGSEGYEVMSVDELKAEDPETYADIELADDEIMFSESALHSWSITDSDYQVGGLITLGDDTKHTYTIVGTFSDDIDADYVLNDQGCEWVKQLAIYNARACYIYNEDTDAVEEALTEYAKDYRTAFSLTVTVPYQEQLQEYLEAHSVDFDAKSLIAVIITVISLVMIYFTMKSNAVSRSEELTVYRLIGITKGSIIKAYVLEMMLITTCTSLPAVLLTCGVIKYISAIPSLGISLVFPVWCIVLLLLAIYAVHAIISILPVYGILSKPPATLAVKE